MFLGLAFVAALVAGQQADCQGGNCNKEAGAKVTVCVDGSCATINKDPAAYNHALREARILAARERVWHPLGVAPGCRYAGTGCSNSEQSPNHCYRRELPNSRIVARAVVRSKSGRFFWSAHYR